MDLNQLFHSHQVALMAAENAASDRARVSHEAVASCYADRIEQAQSKLGATAPFDRHAR